MIGIALTLLSLALPAALVMAVIFAVRRRGHSGSGARGVRRFFQYLLLLALTIVAAIGVADLLGRLLGSDAPGDEALARSLAFTLVGVPLALLIAWWTRGAVRQDPDERAAPAYAVYLTGAALITLVVAMVSLHGALSALLRGHYDAGALGASLVWGGLWFLHWRLAHGVSDVWPHLLVGSLIGLGTAVVGLALLLGASLTTLLLDADQLVLGSARRLAGHGATLAVGAAVWVRYWIMGGLRLPRKTPWFTYVLPVGVGGGLLVAVSAASVFLWQILVWWLGDPADTARQHFGNSPNAFAFAIVGVLVWWYHRGVLGKAETRTEVWRIYEYLVSAIGLLAAATGVGTTVVAVIESVTPGLDLGMSVRNTLLGAITLLVVGIPLWWFFWARIRRARTHDAVGEVSSPTRRVYLVLLFGIAGVAAVIALIVVAFVAFQDVIAGVASLETLRSMRYALGVLIAAAAVSAYHGAVYREDRDVVLPTRLAGPRSVLLIGAAAPGLEHALRRATGARVELAVRTDAAAPPWSEDALLAALADHPGEDLVVMADAELRVIAVHRS